MRYVLLSNKRIAIFLVSLCLFQETIYAQDPVYSQAFLSPIYLNPAATGTGEHDLRISGMYRRQWWTIPTQMTYAAFSVDKYFGEVNSGIGILGTHSTEGYLNKNGIYGSYSYNICSGPGDVAANSDVPRWFWTGGLQFGVAQSRIDYNKLVFADQLDINGVLPVRSSADPAINNGKFFPDFAAGMFFNYNLRENTRVLAGFSGHHINRPDESLTSSSDAIRSPLPVRWTGNLLYTHTNPDEPWSYSVAAIGYRQANNSSYQVGIEVTQNDYDISAGLYYRGNVNFRNMNTITMTLSFSLSGRENDRDKMRIGIAHDAQVGNNSYSYTTGSSELGFVWDHRTNNNNSDGPCKPVIGSTICPGVTK